MSEKIALILGVDGQDGSYLAEFLLDKNYVVVGWIPSTISVKLDNIQHILDRIELTKGNLLDQESLEQCISQYYPDEIYNLASPSSPSASWSSPVIVGEVAGLGVARLLKAVRKIRPDARFYQASTSELFGEPTVSPQNEAIPFHPRNPYGVAKLYAHYMVMNYRAEHHIFAVNGILYNHESPRRGLEFVTRKITYTAARIKLGLETKLPLGNLDARRDWGFAGDYVEAMWLMLQLDAPQDFVIGSGESHSVRDFCAIAFEHLGLDYREYVLEDKNFFRPSEQVQLVADPSKAGVILGWWPKTPFKDLVIKMVDADMTFVRQ